MLHDASLEVAQAPVEIYEKPHLVPWLEKNMRLVASLDDGISSLSFDGNQLLCSCWDGCARLYDITSPDADPLVVRRGSPLLCASLCDKRLACAGIDGQVWAADRVVGSHDGGVRCMEWLEDGALFTGGWDGAVKRWDHRSREAETQRASCGGKVFAMCARGRSLIVGTSDRIIHILDTRKLAEPVKRRVSPLEKQMRDLACLGSEDRYVASSIDGRIAVETEESSYSFKCHRKDNTAYPVNCVAARRGNESGRPPTFASGGGDGRINFWDPTNRKRLPSSPDHQFLSSISALAFGNDANDEKIAAASSYTFEHGEEDVAETRAPNQIFIL